MQRYSLPSQDTIPAIGLGTWKSSDQVAYAATRAAIECGYQHIDCAPIYMNEKPIGSAIKDAIAKKNISRDSLWITSKLWNSFHAPEDVIEALKSTLYHMQLDYLDLYLMHWPVAMRKSLGHARANSGSDFVSLDNIPLHTTWEAMQESQKLGLVKNLGVSNFSANKIQHLIDQTSIAPSVNQIECHPYLSQKPLIDYCKTHHIHVTAYAPLGSGDRPSFMKSQSEPSLLENPMIMDIAKNHNCTTAQVLIRWAHYNGTSVIPKSTHPERMQQNLKSVRINLTEDDIETVNNLNQDFRFITGEFFEKPGSGYTKSMIWE